MAKIICAGISGLSGRIDNLVFRQCGGSTIVSRRSKPYDAKIT